MCLAVPAKIVECEGDQAVADLHGNRVRINTLLVPEAKVGDWVLIHAGFAIQYLDCKSAEETFAVLEDLEAAVAAEGSDGTPNR
jgi:hydrogenase expression/formation protein HypC